MRRAMNYEYRRQFAIFLCRKRGGGKGEKNLQRERERGVGGMQTGDRRSSGPQPLLLLLPHLLILLPGALR